MTMSPRRIVVTDANVLINLIHVARLDICASLPGYEFVIPDHVREEIKDSGQRTALDEAIARSVFRIESITTIVGIALFDELKERMGHGEAACLALAVGGDWMVASDEKGRFRREAESRIGGTRLIGTKHLYLLAIGAGLIGIDEADADKDMLEEHHRFRMDFDSFHNLMR
ncbi:MAG: hypothetical protein ACYC99_07145 [Candidatus Geothermincolia bacterium]